MKNKNVPQISKILCIILIVISASCSRKDKNIYVITDFGAKGDSASLNTRYIQAAVDRAFKNGGGKVVVPAPGKFITGTIMLKDNITFEIEAGASIIGSDTITDYIPYKWENFNRDVTPYHLIIAKDAKNVTLEGRGSINGRGWNFWEYTDVQPRWMITRVDRPSPMVSFENCTNAKIRDLLLTNSAGWTLHLLECEHVEVNSLRIINNLYGPNNDGIDINGSRNIIVSDCYIKTCDDAICIKAYHKDSFDIVATNNILETSCVALKLDENFHNISDASFSNCVIRNSSRGIGIYGSHGGKIENVAFNNIICNTNAPLVLNRPIQISSWDNKDKDGKVINKAGLIRNITISDFVATTQGRILVSSNDGKNVKSITLRDIKINYPYIEDPLLYTPTIRSSQIKGMEPEAKNACAAVVASNVIGFVLDGLQISWPENDNVPVEWRHPERIENGNFEMVHHPVYDKAKQTEFNALYMRNCEGGYVFAPLAYSSSEWLTPLKIERSDIRIIRNKD